MYKEYYSFRISENNLSSLLVIRHVISSRGNFVAAIGSRYSKLQANVAEM